MSDKAVESAEECRAVAELLRALQQLTNSPDIRAELSRVADAYELLASRIEVMALLPKLGLVGGAPATLH